MTFGEPEGDRPDSLRNWLLGEIAGAPAGLLVDTVDGAQSLFKGDLEKAFEKLFPAKAVADLAKTYRLATEGKTGRGGEPGMAPLSPVEAGVQAFGFKPGRVAQYDTAAWGARKALREEGKGRREALDAYSAATTSAERARAMKLVSAYNEGKSPDEKITSKQLAGARRRREEAGRLGGSMLGQRVTDRNRAILKQFSETYGVQ
ncbi:hypothetical protein [Methylocella sp.]|uniref:hypothetical protein n=1 Tax=Methylocella sp. TaxID=1978226 RepID=UPI0035AFF159